MIRRNRKARQAQRVHEDCEVPLDSDELENIQHRIELLEKKAGVVGKPDQKYREYEMQNALNRLQRMEQELKAFNRREGRA